MPSRPCLRCGRLSAASYCAAHMPIKKPTPGRGSGWAITRFRTAVLDRAGHRCQAIENGHRCTATTSLQAHHAIPLAHGGTNDPANGVAVCRPHHEVMERETRHRR